MKESGQMKRRYQIVHKHGNTYNVRFTDGEKNWYGREKWFFARSQSGWDWEIGTYTELGAEIWIENNMVERNIHEENEAKYAEPREVPPFLLIDNPDKLKKKVDDEK